MLRPLPIVIIGGYLGAGKTTLVNHLLRHAGARRIAVLVNDFGEINIDADLIEGSAAGVISLSGGCICCSFGDDLVGTLQALAQGTARPDLVLIELSGVALPAPVARNIRLARGVERRATLVLVDAAAIGQQANDRYVGETVRQQLREADAILLNKTDLASADAAAALPQWLTQIAPQAEVLSCDARSIDPAWVLDRRPQTTDTTPDNAPDSTPALATMAGRPIGAQQRRARNTFASRSIALPTDVDLPALGRALAASDSGVLRAKALARQADGQGCCLQVSAGRWQVDPAPVPSRARLLVIGLRESRMTQPSFFERLGL